jgi:hypothetical protein
MKNDIADLDVVALLTDLPADGLQAGQTGTVLLTHDGGRAFEVEFILPPRRVVLATVEREKLLKLKGLDLSAPAR